MQISNSVCLLMYVCVMLHYKADSTAAKQQILSGCDILDKSTKLSPDVVYPTTFQFLMGTKSYFYGFPFWGHLKYMMM